MGRGSRFPTGWDEERVRRVLAYYEEDRTHTVMEIPVDLVPEVRKLLAGRKG
jgi:hypothetical protein